MKNLTRPAGLRPLFTFGFALAGFADVAIGLYAAQSLTALAATAGFLFVLGFYLLLADHARTRRTFLFLLGFEIGALVFGTLALLTQLFTGGGHFEALDAIARSAPGSPPAAQRST